ncbi:amino acid ABC transporter substrate-binding protein [Pseudooctadecabacter jejudonensis]|uniref:General L-amino acid-binding periplasmic protein AapJ n=1 Tax=Pseudooctadecabacter jejudonensis TaxID=1391910 RepID=A0A1Y5SQ38_9RHOB|nr:amino acid ABC transporter substrate-binding protein [Pseudooctadecabacter jejudonensis]SLN45679.1 General L-amino acid-binding periplasmic protein AapJ precursor [Pseudooctadecabacter jejudonensis]
MKFLRNGAAIALAFAPVSGFADTLEDVQARGQLLCGVNTGLSGFSFTDADGNWTGFDVDMCRAVAAAVLGDADAVEYIPLTGKTRFTALSSGEIDFLSRNTTWTYSRDSDLAANFVGTSYYDGQGFLTRAELGVSSVMDLDGATICIKTGTTTELTLSEFFRSNGMTYEPVPIESDSEAQQQYNAKSCDVFTADASALAANRASFADPDAHVILPEIISKEPLGPAVRHGDDRWHDIVGWTLNALIAAEELGITSENARTLGDTTNSPEIKRLLGVDGDLGAMNGLSATWAQDAIAAVGNYGEIFDRHLGTDTVIGLERGLNAQWFNGGLQYAPPFR